MKNARSRHRLIFYIELLGFLALLFISWLDEGVLIPRHLLGSWFEQGTWHEAILESFAIFLVGLLVIAYSQSVLKRLHYLENFLRVCAWCRKLDLDGKWVPMEEFLKSKGDIECSHGICQECAEKINFESFKKKRTDNLSN